MADAVETVAIESKDFDSGYLIINKSDFDVKAMKLYSAPAPDRGKAAKQKAESKDAEDAKQ